MEKSKKELNPPVKHGHGLNRAHKNEHKERVKSFKHQKKWIEDRMDNI